MAREVNSRLLRTLSMLRYCSAGTNLAELVRIGKEMGYEGEELQRFVDKQQEREERLLAQEREERLLAQEREERREERLLAQEERREERQRQHEMQIRRPEVQRKAQKRLEGDRKGECCFSRSESLLTEVLLRVTP